MSDPLVASKDDKKKPKEEEEKKSFSDKVADALLGDRKKDKKDEGD